MTALNIITWNVRGKHTPSKRYAIYAYLHRHTAHVALLQETHLQASEIAHLRRRWRGQIYSTNYGHG